MGRMLAILGGILVLAVLAAGLTEATLAIGHHGRLSDDLSLRPKATVTPSRSASPSATPTPTAPPVVATPVPTPMPTPVVIRVATTNAFVHMRAGKSIYTAILVDLNGGTRVELLPDSDSQWQQVRYNGLVGYIFKTYLTY